MATLALEFANMGHDVDMILAKAEGPYIEDIQGRVRIFDLKKKHVSSSFSKLIKYLRKEKPDVILSTLNNANIITIISKIISKTNVRVLVRQANTLSLNQLNLSKKLRFRDKIIPLLVRCIYPLADAIVAVSHGVEKDLIEYANIPKNKIKVIYNPVIDDRLHVLSLEKIYHPWFVDKAFPVILSAGRLNRQKDYRTLIEAVAIVRDHVPVRLVILGEGEERRNLERLVDEKQMNDIVSMPGFVNNPFPYMKQADLFVLSSIFEGLPNVLIQSLALGTPVISTDCPSGPREILDDGRHGKLVPVQNSFLLAESIIKAIESDNFNQNINDFQSYKFDIVNIVNQYLNLMFTDDANV
ncbi:Glycosyltransferase Gtf1 [anaerobic digester metagenome]